MVYVQTPEVDTKLGNHGNHIAFVWQLNSYIATVGSTFGPII
jgi:hypothetical protein